MTLSDSIIYLRILSAKGNSARLACVRHAASVRPEPGSNSQIIFENLISSLNKSIYTSHYCVRLPFSGAHLSHKLRSSKLVFLVLLASIVLYTADFFLVFVSKNQVVKFASYSILKSFYDFGIFRVPLHVYHCLLFKVHFVSNLVYADTTAFQGSLLFARHKQLNYINTLLSCCQHFFYFKFLVIRTTLNYLSVVFRDSLIMLTRHYLCVNTYF